MKIDDATIESRCPDCGRSWSYGEPISLSMPYGHSNYFACFGCQKGFLVKYRTGRGTVRKGYVVKEEPLTDEARALMQAAVG